MITKRRAKAAGTDSGPARLKKHALIGLVVAAGLSLAAMGVAQAQELSIGFGDDTAIAERAIQLIGLLTILSLAPSILVMVTSFTRIVVVLSLLRTAIGLRRPIAVRNSESTTTMRVKLVTITRMDGAKDRMVRRPMSWMARSAMAVSSPKPMESSCAWATPMAASERPAATTRPIRACFLRRAGPLSVPAAFALRFVITRYAFVNRFRSVFFS